MYHILESKIKTEYIISTSEYGVGSEDGSNKTPLGLHKIKEKFGNIKRAFSLIGRVLKQNDWAEVEKDRSEDLLIYLGLTKFTQRPVLSALPIDVQLDIKSFFGSYREACKQADELLFSAGNQSLINLSLIHI